MPHVLHKYAILKFLAFLSLPLCNGPSALPSSCSLLFVQRLLVSLLRGICTERPNTAPPLTHLLTFHSKDFDLSSRKEYARVYGMHHRAWSSDLYQISLSVKISLPSCFPPFFKIRGKIYFLEQFKASLNLCSSLLAPLNKAIALLCYTIIKESQTFCVAFLSLLQSPHVFSFLFRSTNN